MATTLLTLANALGVSRTTVSNAYSRPEKLSPELRERILTAAHELGYDGPSSVAASLRRGRTDTLGVLFTDDLRYAFSDPVSSLFLAGLAGRAQDRGYAITIVSAPRGGGSGPLSRAMADGLVVYSVDEDSPALPVARRRGLPLVLVDQAPQPGTTRITVADRAGAGAAMAHLIGLAHRDVGVVGVALGPPRCAPVPAAATSPNHVVRERLAGWLAACASAGLPPPAVISCPVNGAEHGRHAARLLLAARPMPTAIACLSDELAIGVTAELTAHGVKVPEQVSVVGFDDSPVAAAAHPALTTVHQPVREKGDLAAAALIDQLGGGRPGPDRELPTRLVVRASTAPAPDTRANRGTRGTT